MKKADANKDAGRRRDRRLGLRFLRLLRELAVILICATIFTLAFKLVILADKPWLQSMLAWVAVWFGCDIYQFRRPQNDRAVTPATEQDGGK